MQIDMKRSVSGYASVVTVRIHVSMALQPPWSESESSALTVGTNDR